MNIRNWFPGAPQDDTLMEAALEAAVSALEEKSYDTPTPRTQPCHTCGSIFLEQKLSTNHTITIATDKGQVQAITLLPISVCGACTPPADIKLSLVEYGSEQDERHFDVSDLFFQEIDAATKEAVCTVTPDQYAELTCDNCGEFVKRPQVTRCSNCKQGS